MKTVVCVVCGWSVNGVYVFEDEGRQEESKKNKNKNEKERVKSRKQ